MRFLLGPAGSGKTFRCLAEIRAQLLAEPEGPPLVLLAPKQATFQLERQLLCEGDLAGYTRLHILSFERLADFVLRQSQRTPCPLLSEQGRMMVLRALLRKLRDQFKIFRNSAGMNGFVQQLSLDLRELQRHQLSPDKLDALAKSPDLNLPLRHKLHDLALLLRAYLTWLEEHQLEDVDRLLDLATNALTEATKTVDPEEEPNGAQGVFSFSLFHGTPSPRKIRIAAIWLDGFAEMTPQELSMLEALAPCVDRMTLAFCVNNEQVMTTGNSWLSIWSGVNQTRLNCQLRLTASRHRVEVEALPGPGTATRFADNPALNHLERNWTHPKPYASEVPSNVLRLAVCPNPQGEALLAAQEIMRFVRSGGRYREAAILLRKMDGYHDELRRTLTRYGIPFFLDRRESVAHHPLAELTRCALGVIANDWRHEDWFGALKTGLVSDDEMAIDWLENEALARGWRGAAWLSPLPLDASRAAWGNQLREAWVAPFLKLKQNLSKRSQLCPTGEQLADALRAFWQQLRVLETLERWSEKESVDRQAPAPHATVWTQMNAWADDVALAFPNEALPLNDWLPILESGLSGLTIGVIPPALDQVLIGTIDRSRNPDLKLAIILGVNESVFPATPSARNLLTEGDREALEKCRIFIGANTRQLLSRERFLGYIACTRSRGRLVVGFSQRDANDATLNPSPFIAQLRALFPNVLLEVVDGLGQWHQAEHASELVGPYLQASAESAPAFPIRPEVAALREQFGSLSAQAPSLTPAMATALYGPVLKTSVSRLEQFAACPFRFLIDSGFRAEERRLFELDVREKGSFQHAVLAEFHLQIKAQGKRWRDLTPQDARNLIGQIAAQLAPGFRDGLLAMDAKSRFTVQAMTESLKDFIATVIAWMPQYDFDPDQVEKPFGNDAAEGFPALELDLGNGQRLLFRGIIDRIDLCPIDADSAYAVVIDYKSSDRRLEKILLDNGLQLQLPAYLSVLKQLSEPGRYFKYKRLVPAGVFYVNLQGRFEGGATRHEVLQSLDDSRQAAYQHTGRFDLEALPHLDNRRPIEGTQFKFKLTKNGEPYKTCLDPMPSPAFHQLLNQVEAHLTRMGREIFAGRSHPDPYQKGRERACERCDFSGICRIDPWTHKFRVLRSE